MNASDMTGGTVHTEVNIPAPSRGFTGVRVCSKVRACVFPEECVCVCVCVQRCLCVSMPLLTSCPLPCAVCPLTDAAVDFAVAVASPLPSPLPLPLHVGLEAVCDSQGAAQRLISRIKVKFCDHVPNNQGNTSLFQEHFN